MGANITNMHNKQDPNKQATVLRNSTDFFENSFDNMQHDVLNNVCLCIIDIVGFSSWCSGNQSPYTIAESMFAYNKLICATIFKFELLKKIELVGDSCMIISGGTNANLNINESVSNILLFAVDLITQLTDIQNIFASNRIGIRIGIHLSDVIGVYIEDPHKYQLFGNDVNICSRLEASANQNTIHLSEKTLIFVDKLSTNITINKFDKSGCITKHHKGVGTINSYIIYLKLRNILLVNFDFKFTETLLPACYDYESDTDVQINIRNFNSFKYKCVFVHFIGETTNDEIDVMLTCLLHKPNHISQSLGILCSDKHVQYITESTISQNNISVINTTNNLEYINNTCNDFITESTRLFDNNENSNIFI